MGWTIFFFFSYQFLFIRMLKSKAQIAREIIKRTQEIPGPFSGPWTHAESDFGSTLVMFVRAHNCLRPPPPWKSWIRSWSSVCFPVHFRHLFIQFHPFSIQFLRRSIIIMRSNPKFNSRYRKYAIWPRDGACHANQSCAAPDRVDKRLFSSIKNVYRYHKNPWVWV